MRFCPFCSAESPDGASSCSACGRRLPPLPPRRRNKGPDTKTTTSSEQSQPDPALAGLAPKEKGLADLAPSPAALRREAPEAEPRPEGLSERRTTEAPAEASAEAVPSPVRRAHSGTLPPIPDRSERDRVATISARVATATEEHEWPAPRTSPAAHPDDWNIVAAPASRTTPALKVAPVPAPVSPDPVTAPVPPTPVALRAPEPPAPVSPVSEIQGDPSKPVVESERTGPTAWPPATRANIAAEPFKAPVLAPIPDVPEVGIFQAMKYAVRFARARWQRRGAITELREQISKETGLLDGILGTLGKHARSLGVKTRALEAENEAIDEAEKRRKNADHGCSELSNRQADENSKFAGSEGDRQTKLAEEEGTLERAQSELGSLEAQRRGLRDKRKEIERRQKGYLKAADGREADISKQEGSEAREALRRAAADFRKDAAELDKERQDIERRVEALEKPIAHADATVDSLKAEVDTAKRALTDAREGHRHRLAEIEAEQGRKSRELAQAEAEIQRRLVTLGTLVNLNRVERPEFDELYEQIDTLRGAIGARSNEIDKLSAEREAYDKGSLVRGASLIAGTFVVAVTVLVIILAL